MRSLVALLLLPGLLAAAPALQLVRPIISQMDGGTPDTPGFEHVPGEVLFFSCRVSGYTKSADEKVQIAYSVQAFDAKGVPLTELFKNEIATEVSPQDKEWMPKIATEVQIPPLVASGSYKILIKVDDVIAKTSAELTAPFQVRGKTVEPSDVITVRNFKFYRSEDETEPAEKPFYKPGDGVFAHFDITGYAYGEKNKIDVSYVTSVITSAGKVLWTQPEAAVERSESFYPKRYVPAAMGINLQKNIRPGEYVIAVQVKDGIGGKEYEGKFNFTVE
jgi:hypothetical protein